MLSDPAFTSEITLQVKKYLMESVSSVARSCLTLCNPMECSTPGFPVHYQLPELAQTTSIESVMPSNHLILSCPLLLLPSVFPSIRVFSNESVLIRYPKYWSFSFSISLSNEYSGLISFRIDYSAIKRNRLLVHATAQMNLQGMRLSEKIQS